MFRSFSMALAAVLTFGLASMSMAAPSLTSLTVDGSMAAEGTVGAKLTIVGSELGTKAPKAVLKLHGDATAKPIALKLLKPFDGTTLRALVAKVTPGVYDVVVTVKGQDPVTLDSAFTAKAPEITSLSLAKVAPGDHLDILGRFFGTIKGKVTIDGVAAKVFGRTGWAEGKITVVIGKKNKSNATAQIDVVGRGGSLDNGAVAEVVAPLGKDSLVIHLDQGGGTVAMTTSQSMSEALGFNISGGKKSGFTGYVFAIVHTDSVGALEGVYTANLGVTFTTPGIPPATYKNGAGFSVTIARRVGNRCQGSFSGVVTKLGGIGAGPNSYNLTGEFTLTIK